MQNDTKISPTYHKSFGRWRSIRNPLSHMEPIILVFYMEKLSTPMWHVTWPFNATLHHSSLKCRLIWSVVCLCVVYMQAFQCKKRSTPHYIFSNVMFTCLSFIFSKQSSISCAQHPQCKTFPLSRETRKCPVGLRSQSQTNVRLIYKNAQTFCVFYPWILLLVFSLKLWQRPCSFSNTSPLHTVHVWEGLQTHKPGRG